MIGCITLGTNDKPKVKAYYDEFVAPLNVTSFESNEMVVVRKLMHG